MKIVKMSCFRVKLKNDQRTRKYEKLINALILVLAINFYIPTSMTNLKKKVTNNLTRECFDIVAK